MDKDDDLWLEIIPAEELIGGSNDDTSEIEDNKKEIKFDLSENDETDLGDKIVSEPSGKGYSF